MIDILCSLCPDTAGTKGPVEEHFEPFVIPVPSAVSPVVSGVIYLCRIHVGRWEDTVSVVLIR